MSRVLVVLSGHPDDVRPILASARARFAADAITVVVRASQASALADLLAGVRVLHDKPAGSRLAFVRALRRERFAHGLVAWTGAWSYWPSKLLFALARARTREVWTEHGTFVWSWRAAARHLVWRALSPGHATAGMPPGIPWPMALPMAALRATVGRALAPLAILGRQAWQAWADRHDHVRRG